jgi:hypothetical protein
MKICVATTNLLPRCQTIFAIAVYDVVILLVIVNYIVKMSTALIQHEVVYNQYLPYAVELDNESTNLLSEIKRNLTTSVLSHELQSAVHWALQLKRYSNYV